MPAAFNQIKNFLDGSKKRLRFKLRVYSGSFGKDTSSLLIILAIQIFFFTRLLPQMLFGLILPWIVILFVMDTKKQGIFYAMVAAFMLESYQSTPAGFYFFSFASIASLLFITRNHISWRRLFPWVVVFTLCTLWISFYEVMLLSIKTKNSDWLSQNLAFEIFINLVCCILFGLWLVKKQVMTYFEEPRVE